MNYLFIYLKYIDQIIVNHDKCRDSVRHSPKVVCPKNSTPTVNAPKDQVYFNIFIYFLSLILR